MKLFIHLVLLAFMIILFQNCSGYFSVNTQDFGENSSSASDNTPERTPPSEPLPIEPPPIGTPPSETPLMNTTPSPNYRDVFISDPDWSIIDDFEGAKDTRFWGYQHDTDFGFNCSSSSAHTSKVLQFTFTNFLEGGKNNAHSEQRFKIPAKAVEIEMRYKLFVPSNYYRSSGNQKNFTFWSGAYSLSKGGNIFIGSEIWPTSEGATASINTMVKFNYGHHMLKTEKPFFENYAGKWQEVVVHIKLAESEGQFGFMRIYKNKQYITGTDHPDIFRPGSWSPVSSETLPYSTRGNFIDHGYLMGWVNGGFKEKTIFCMDDFSIDVKTN